MLKHSRSGKVLKFPLRKWEEAHSVVSFLVMTMSYQWSHVLSRVLRAFLPDVLLINMSCFCNCCKCSTDALRDCYTEFFVTRHMADVGGEPGGSLQSNFVTSAPLSLHAFWLIYLPEVFGILFCWQLCKFGFFCCCFFVLNLFLINKNFVHIFYHFMSCLYFYKRYKKTACAKIYIYVLVSNDAQQGVESKINHGEGRYILWHLRVQYPKHYKTTKIHLSFVYMIQYNQLLSIL